MLEFDVACIPEPKLHRFDTGGAPLKIKFIKKLGEGIHSHVWKVRINKNNYALKMFTHQQDSGSKRFDEMFRDEASQWPYIHAFPNEYRAFARLKEFGQDHLAVTCYGWIEMDESYHEFMDSHIDKYGWSSDECWAERKRYAIVKELLDFGYTDCHHEEVRRAFVSPEVARKAFKGIRTMHNLGIFVGDIKGDNFTWGKYVDFSRSWTAPHPFTADPAGSTIEGPPSWDARNLEEMVHSRDIFSWNSAFPAEKIWDHLIPNPEYIGKLRSSKGLSRSEIRKKCYARWSGHPENFTYQKARKRFGRATDPTCKSERLKATERPEPWKCETCQRERARKLAEGWTFPTPVMSPLTGSSDEST